MPDPEIVNNSVNLPAWGRHHDVLPTFLDLDGRTFDSAHVMQQVTELIEDTPSTAKYIQGGRISDEVDGFNLCNGTTDKLDLVLSLHGAWIPSDEFGKGTRSYINPEYMHLDHLREENYITNEDDRLEHFETVKKHGLVSKTRVATQFGFTDEEFSDWLASQDSEWDVAVLNGHRRVARTTAVMLDWGYSMTDMAAAFGVPTDTLQNIKHEHLSDSFEIPADVTSDMEEARRFQYPPKRNYTAVNGD